MLFVGFSAFLSLSPDFYSYYLRWSLCHNSNKRAYSFRNIAGKMILVQDVFPRRLILRSRHIRRINNLIRLVNSRLEVEIVYVIQ